MNLQDDRLLAVPLMHISFTKAREIPIYTSQSWLRNVDTRVKCLFPLNISQALKANTDFSLFSESLRSDVCERQDIRADGPSVLSNR